MNDGPALPVSPRQVSAVGVLALAVLVFAVGLYAVGPGNLYHGDTWPDFLAMFLACVLLLAGGVELAARDASGTWSWRTLRPRSFIACALAFVLLFVLSATVPAKTGISPVGDSAQGFSMFLFLGSVVVAVTAAVKAPSSAGVSPAGPATAGGDPWASRTRIELRRYGLISRTAYLDVDASGVRVVIPRVFGGGRSWDLPMHMIGVVVPPPISGLGHTDGLDDHGGWVTRRELSVPYLYTTSMFVPPNLTLLFTVPQRIAPIRWSASRDFDFTSSDTRSAAGVAVDGVQLRAVAPEAARHALTAAGVPGIADVEDFVRRHRDVVHDPVKARAVLAARRRSTVISGLTWVAMLACFVGSALTDDDRYGLALVGVVAVSGLLQWLVRRWSRRTLAD